MQFFRNVIKGTWTLITQIDTDNYRFSTAAIPGDFGKTKFRFAETPESYSQSVFIRPIRVIRVKKYAREAGISFQ